MIQDGVINDDEDDNDDVWKNHNNKHTPVHSIIHFPCFPDLRVCVLNEQLDDKR